MPQKIMIVTETARRGQGVAFVRTVFAAEKKKKKNKNKNKNKN